MYCRILLNGQDPGEPVEAVRPRSLRAIHPVALTRMTGNRKKALFKKTTWDCIARLCPVAGFYLFTRIVGIHNNFISDFKGKNLKKTVQLLLYIHDGKNGMNNKSPL